VRATLRAFRGGGATYLCRVPRDITKPVTVRGYVGARPTALAFVAGWHERGLLVLVAESDGETYELPVLGQEGHVLPDTYALLFPLLGADERAGWELLRVAHALAVGSPADTACGRCGARGVRLYPDPYGGKDVCRACWQPPPEARP